MPQGETPLKTQQVADALGVGVSTLKRWVDAGEIKASRTVGNHRVITLAEALRFARVRELGTSALERLAKSSPAETTPIDDRLRDSLMFALKDGRADEARRLMFGAHSTLECGAAFADEVISPVMQRVGHGWSVGEWDVYQEHHASQIVASSITDLIIRITRPYDQARPTALCAGPSGDLYTLPILLGELALIEGGWDVRNLGPNLPIRSLARAIASQRPRLVFLSVSNTPDPIGFIEEIAVLRASARSAGASLILGGRGLTQEIRMRLSDIRVGDCLVDLADFGRTVFALKCD